LNIFCNVKNSGFSPLFAVQIFNSLCRFTVNAPEIGNRCVSVTPNARSNGRQK